MTLPPERLGDQGQQFQVFTEGYPIDGWQVVGWSHTKSGAIQMCEAFLKAPSCTGVRYEDRGLSTSLSKEPET